MAQRKPEDKMTADQVMKLVEQLPPSEKGALRNKMDATWGEQWDSLVAKVEKRNKDLPQLTEEEICAEFTEHRREQRAKRAQSCD